MARTQNGPTGPTHGTERASEQGRTRQGCTGKATLRGTAHSRADGGELMTDYTPTTEEIRTWLEDENLIAEFDRWLAEVKAQAWEEGARAANLYEGYYEEQLDSIPIVNPYRHDPSKVRYLTVDQIPASNHSDRQGEN